MTTGKGSYTARDWTTYASTHVTGKSGAELFTNTDIDPLLNPKDVKIRESRDSDAYPESTALIVGIDQTGSMGMISKQMIREGLNVLATEIYDRKPITDPQIMFMAIGDAAMHERAPLQVTQFEVDIKIAEQLQKFFLEGMGGGNDNESYTFPWYFAAMHTSIDCFEKRGKKGYLFTAGDECVPPVLRASEIERYLGYNPEKDFTAEELLTMVSRSYNVFHIMVEQGSYMRSYRQDAIDSWTSILGQNAIPLSDYTKMSEVIISVIQAMEGDAKDKITASWDGKTSIVVSKAIDGIIANRTGNGGIITFD